MADDQKFNLTLTGPQMDFIGQFTVNALNAANAQAKVASEVYQLLKAAVQPVLQAKPAMAANGGLTVVPEVEVDVSPRSPIP